MSTTPLDALTAGVHPADVGPVALVTGARGFVGKRLVDALVHLGVEEVRALDVSLHDAPPRKGVVPVVADVRDSRAMLAACEGVSTVFHTAARIALHGIGPPSEAREVDGVNVGGTKSVCTAAEAQGVKRLVHTSSHNVVLGPYPLDEVDESVPYVDRFIDVYTPSKIEAERVVLSSDTEGGLRTCALRPGGIWGAGGYMMTAFLGELVKGTFRVYIGRPENLVDQTHLDNLVRAELLAAKGLSRHPERVGGQAYFITDDERLNGMAWFEPVIRQLGYPVPTRWIPRGPVYLAGWLMECIYRLGGPAPVITRASIHKVTCSSSLRTDKARRDLGWEPLVQRDEGLRAMAQWIDAAHERAKQGKLT